MSSAGGFELRLALPEDEPAIRALIGSVAMPGAVAVRFAREPDYFLGASIMGDPCDVLVARHPQSGQLAGMACRAEQCAFINGQEAALGYIGQIRIAPEYRGRGLVQLGAQWFKEASPPGLLYYGVIASENPRALRFLAGPRPPGGIHAARICGLTTHAILLRRQPIYRAPGVDVLPGSPETLAEIVAFLRREGPRRQFFPAYTLEDFTGGRRLRGLSPRDIMVARRGSDIIGVMAGWDQAAYKQDIVDAYGPALLRLRPAYNLAARLLGAQPLPPPGQAMPRAFAACACVAGDDPRVMRALLSACAANARARGKAYLMVGLADGDPLAAPIRRYLKVTYHSELYAFSWSRQAIAQPDGRAADIEIATL